MIELTIAFLAGLAFGHFVLAPLIGEYLYRRDIKRLTARLDAPRKPTLQEATAALEPEIKATQALFAKHAGKETAA